jgi:hypothetical protein
MAAIITPQMKIDAAPDRNVAPQPFNHPKRTTGIRTTKENHKFKSSSGSSTIHLQMTLGYEGLQTASSGPQ